MRVAIILALAGSTLAFPAAVLSELNARAGEAAGCPFAAAEAAKTKRQSPPDVVFDLVKQKIDTAGQYAFVPPKAGDKRGPCPGLNALANHGYLPHSGVTDLVQAIEATNRVFGMGVDIGTILSVYSTVIAGNPLALNWSIGGSPGGLVLPPLLSAPQGLSGTHNKYEGDASATRPDAYLNNGDPNTMSLDFFKQLYNLQPEGPSANFDYDVILQNRWLRRQHSISNNPHFFNAPLTGIVAVPAAHAFITRFMSNHSAENPAGVLNHDVLKSFYGVSGTSNGLKYQKGYERIPDNWYRRNADYTLALFALDLVYAGLKHPEFLSIGGNTGTVNSFAGVNIGDITGGVYNSVNLLQGNNLACFALQATQQAMPDVLKGILGDLTAALGLWTTKITPILGRLGCPELTKYDPSVFKAYPGSSGGAL